MAVLCWRKVVGCRDRLFVFMIFYLCVLLRSGSRWVSSAAPCHDLTRRRRRLLLLLTWILVVPSTSTSWVVLAQSFPPGSSAPPSLAPIPNPSEGMRPFMTAISDRVQRLAEAAKANNDNACDTLKRCNNKLIPCLRLSCGYRENESQDFTCMAGFNFNTSWCNPDRTNAVGKFCENLLVNFQEPFVRYRSIDSVLEDWENVTGTIYQETCIQSPLHDTLKTSLDTQGYNFTGSLYIGFIVGLTITFPGMNMFSIYPEQSFPFQCEPLDPRHRPWFAVATSPKKRVAIVVDLTNEMDRDIGPPTVSQRPTRINFLKETLLSLSSTFRRDDSVTLITVPEGSDEEMGLEIVSEIDNPNRCKQFKARVTSMEARQVSLIDLTDGIQRGISKLQSRPNEEYNETEILMVFTRAGFNFDTAQAVINSYNSSTGRKLPVFLYGVDVMSEAIFQNLTKLAENVSGIARNMGNFDPLLRIYTYFDYLSRYYADVRTPYWAEEYKDILFGGNVTTNVKPVYDLQGHLIGVAAMDVRRQEDNSFMDLAGLDNSQAQPSISISKTLRDTLNLSSCVLPCYDGYHHNYYDDNGIPCNETAKMEDLLCEPTGGPPENPKCCGNCAITDTIPLLSSSVAPPTTPSPASSPSSASLPTAKTPTPSSSSSSSNTNTNTSTPFTKKVGFAVIMATVCVVSVSLATLCLWRRLKTPSPPTPPSTGPTALREPFPVGKF